MMLFDIFSRMSVLHGEIAASRLIGRIKDKRAMKFLRLRIIKYAIQYSNVHYYSSL